MTTVTKRIPGLLAALALAAAPSFALAQVELGAAHVDLGIGYEDGELELHWHDEDSDVEYTPTEAYAFIPLSSTFVRPSGAAWDFVGANAGDTLYIAPQSDVSGVIFLGLGSEEIPAGIFIGDTLDFSLNSVSGPGTFALWQTDSFDMPTAFLGSSTSGPDSFSLTTGGHEHVNWGFTAPGIYEVTFTVTGTEIGETVAISDTATYTFAVGTPIPEPSSAAALAGLGALGLVALRRRRA